MIYTAWTVSATYLISFFSFLSFLKFRDLFMPLFDVRSIWKDASPDSQAYHCSPLLHFHWQGSHNALQMSCDLLEMLSGSCVKDMLWPEEQRQQESTSSHMHCSSQKRSCHVHSLWDICKGLHPLVHFPLSLSTHWLCQNCPRL